LDFEDLALLLVLGGASASFFAFGTI
jgi:hypothetical protein